MSYIARLSNELFSGSIIFGEALSSLFEQRFR